MKKSLLLLAILGVLAACSQPAAAPAPAADAAANRLQRDSALARSKLPGAPAVERALGAVEAANARTAAFDTIR
jgi:hypothetical protein